MKYFSFKIFFLCILLPPVLYPISLEFIEDRLKDRCTAELEDLYISDPNDLLNGTAKLKDAVSDNIDRYLEAKPFLSWGVVLSVTVTTGNGRLLYPGSFDEENDQLLSNDPIKTAAENYKLMNEGLKIKVDLNVGHNTLIANAILAFYILISIVVLYFYYRIGERKSRADEWEKSRQIERLLELEKRHMQKLDTLDLKKKKLSSELLQVKENLSIEKGRASRNEDELIEDMASLEDKISTNLELQKKQRQEIEALKEKIKSSPKGKKKKKPSGTAKKRFKTLYKNILVHGRAAERFVELQEDMKIKCEEVIHQLNEDPNQVNIKRKVFGKKNRATVLEVNFAYKGRLYFRKTPDNKIEILAIGTKNTQAKELEFLDSL